MATIRELAIKNLRDDIAHYTEQIEKFRGEIIKYVDAPDTFLDVELPADAIVNGHIYPSLLIPFDHARNDAIIGELYEAIGHAPEKTQETLEATKNWQLGTNVQWYLSGTFSTLTVRFDPGTGAACKLVQVGTRTVEEPLYKIECAEVV